MTTTTSRPVPGTDAYWRTRAQAFALIRAIEQAIDARRRAPMYLAGPGYDAEDGFDDVIENIGPWQRVADLQLQAYGDRTVLEILAAQKRLDLLAA